MLNNKIYDTLKWLALVALDAVGVFYRTLCLIWGFPYGDEVLATCSAVSVLIGALIGVSGVIYQNKKEEAQNDK